MNLNRWTSWAAVAAQIAATFGVGVLVLLAGVLAFPVVIAALALFSPFLFGLDALAWCRVGWAIRIRDRLWL